MAREILFELGKMITDRLPYKFGIKKLTEEDISHILDICDEKLGNYYDRIGK